MRLLLLLIPLVAAAVAVGVHFGRSEHNQPKRVVYGPGAASADIADTASGVQFVPSTERAVGAFRLSRGRALDLATADTSDGKSCLVESGENGAGGRMCLEGGLFAHRKVAFVVDSQGGPDHFDELYVPGVVAADVRSADIVKTDGSSAALGLTKQGAFVYESTPKELRQAIYPSGLRLYGASGKLVQALRFPVNP